MKQKTSFYKSVLVIAIPVTLQSLLQSSFSVVDQIMIGQLGSTSIAAIGLAGKVLNYLLIFGKYGFPKMEVKGAAIATVISQIFGFLMILGLFLRYYNRKKMKLEIIFSLDRPTAIQYVGILLPILVCEFFWSLGENVYASIYGHLGTMQCAAMALKSPLQMLMIGSLNGLSQAAGVLIGKTLGEEDYERAYWESKKLMQYGFVCSFILSVILLLTGRYYVQIYQVEPEVRTIAVHILIAFALISPIKVQNMILGGGIIRSGGKTKYIMWIDLIGTWCFGVPLGLLSAFVWKLSIPYVYFVLSLEECVRYAITLVLFKKRSWMQILSK